MRVTLLGTGAADGWPQPFCRCASCTWARQHGQVRGRSGLLIDDSILIDPSPDTITAAARAKVALDRVTTVLIGHAHPDHLDPSLFLARSWVSGLGAVQVIGPRSALDALQPWLDPEAVATGAITLTEVELDTDIALPSGHSARALPAEHGLGADGHRRHDLPEGEHDAVLWEVTSPDGHRLLYAADTGPLPDSTLAALRPLELLLLEETFGEVATHGTAHLDLSTFPLMLSALRSRGVIDGSTEVVALHLSHHNPTEPELTRRLAAWGARPGVDGEHVHITGETTHGLGQCVPQRTLITGGARSGKSREAERRLLSHPQVTYIATAAPRHDDPEWRQRVSDHRQRRPDSWSTFESGGLAELIGTASESDALLVDCLTLWLSRLIDEADAWTEPDRAREVAMSATSTLVAALELTRAEVVIVTNEVGSGIVPAHASGRLFQDLLGEVNSRVAHSCDTVVLTVAGRAVTLTSPTASTGGMT